MNFLPDYELDMILGKPLANKVKAEMICPIHKRKVILNFDYDKDGANAYIVKYCCIEHAQNVADALSEIEFFNNVIVEKQKS